MKKISIIIPIYNAGNYLRRCIDSVIDQEYSNLEIILINDGSTDNSEEIMNEYKNKYPNLIKCYNKENTGVADTRNFGIEKASGEYIMFLDCDDYIDKSLFESFEQYLDDEVELIKFKLQRVNDKGKVLEIVDGAIFDKVSGQEGFNRLYSTDVLLDSPCVYLIKKEIFTRNNLKFMVGTEHEDFGLIPFVVILAKTMVSINFYGYYYVQSDNSITRNEDYKKTIKKAYDALSHYDNAIKLIEKLDITKKTKENVKIYYTNAIILKAKELKEEDQDKYIEEIKNRKMVKNIKIRNIKQLLKRILLTVDIKTYLKSR